MSFIVQQYDKAVAIDIDFSQSIYSEASSENVYLHSIKSLYLRPFQLNFQSYGPDGKLRHLSFHK